MEDLRGRRVLEDEPGGSGAQGPQHLFVGVEGGEHDDLGRVRAAPQPLGRRESVRPRHPDVHEDDVRAGAVDERHDLVTVGGLADDLHVLGTAQHEGQPGPHQRVVVDEEQSDRSHASYVITVATGRLGVAQPHGSLARTSKPPPGVGPCSRVPPASVARSVSPISP